jgi:hypothetical protein
MSIVKLNEMVESPSAAIGASLLDVVSGVPLGTILVNVYKIGVGIDDFLIVKKLSTFLSSMKNMEEEANEYLDSLPPEKRHKVGEFMLNSLCKAESSDKAQILGFIFKACVGKRIGMEMMLRLTSIVNKAFILDLVHLPEYKESSAVYSIAANEFINLGLMDNEVGGVWRNEPTWELNDIGLTLCKILEDEGWFQQQSQQ